MAKVIDKVLKSRAVYPWEKWCDGQVWELKQGEDFVCTLQGMCAAIYGRGQSLGQKVVVSMSSPKKTVTFQFQTEAVEEEKKPAAPKKKPSPKK